jgi:hypothetical protein
MQARVHPNHMPEETMGRENMPAPIAPPVIIATQQNLYSLFIITNELIRLLGKSVEFLPAS